jgi:hypothetical protein
MDAAAGLSRIRRKLSRIGFAGVCPNSRRQEPTQRFQSLLVDMRLGTSSRNFALRCIAR